MLERRAERQAAKGRQRGSILVYLVVGLVVFGVLALAGAMRFSATVRGVLSPNCATSARYMAESGLRYAMAALRSYTDEAALISAVAALNGSTTTVDAAKGLSFTLAVTYTPGTQVAQVTATGRSCNNIAAVSQSASNNSVNLPALVTGPPEIIGVKDVKATSDLASGGSAAVSVNVGADTITMGNSGYADAGAAWYAGNNTLCLNGNCTLGSGICAYWEHVFNASSQGDGYVWTIMSGDTNTVASFGGSTSMGELMGYGGPGSSGKGIVPPKLGLEFDIYENDCYNNMCAAGSRCDPNANDHAAFVFWGSNTVSGCTSNTYDDNRHGAGAGNASEPINSYNFTGGSNGRDGFYVRSSGSSNWLKGGSRGYIRYELDRPSRANADGNYVYTERAWTYNASDTRPGNMNNCTATVTANPTLVRTFALTPALHNQLTKVFFGWTEGTGGATQFVTLYNFRLAFKGAPTEAAYAPPAGYVVGYNFSQAQGATAKDLNGNSHPLTLYDNSMWGPDARAYDNASLLVAGSGWGEADHKSDLILTSAGTLAAWIKMNSYTEAGGIIHKGDDTDDEDYSLQLNSATTSGILTFQMQKSGSNQFILDSDNGALTTGVWTHVAVTWDVASLIAKLYVNGTMIKSKAIPAGWTVRNSGGHLLVGAQSRTSGWGTSHLGFDGLIDDVYIYNTALTAAQVAALAGK